MIFCANLLGILSKAELHLYSKHNYAPRIQQINTFLILCLYKKGQGCQSHLACFDTMLAQIKTKFFLFIVRTAPFWLTSALVSLMISIRGPVNPDSHYVTFFPSDCLAVLPGLLNHSLSMATIMVNR